MVYFKIKPYLLLLPASFIVLGITLTGVSTAFAESLGYFPVVGLRQITVKYYKEVLLEKTFLQSFKFSIFTSMASALIAIVIGVLLAYLISQSKNRQPKGLVLYKIPILVPHTVGALLVFNILSQSGILPRTLYTLGIVKAQTDFPNLIFDSKGIGIIITYLWKEIPFVTMVTYGVLSNIDEKLSLAARSLGASKRQVFKHVYLPLILPSVFSCFIIIFSFSFGAFEVPFLLGPTTPKTLPVMAYLEYSNPDLSNRPYAMVINMILIALSFLLVYLYEKSFKLIYKK